MAPPEAMPPPPAPHLASCGSGWRKDDFFPSSAASCWVPADLLQGGTLLLLVVNTIGIMACLVVCYELRKDTGSIRTICFQSMALGQILVTGAYAARLSSGDRMIENVGVAAAFAVGSVLSLHGTATYAFVLKIGSIMQSAYSSDEALMELWKNKLKHCSNFLFLVASCTYSVWLALLIAGGPKKEGIGAYILLFGIVLRSVFMANQISSCRYELGLLSKQRWNKAKGISRQTAELMTVFNGHLRLIFSVLCVSILLYAVVLCVPTIIGRYLGTILLFSFYLFGGPICTILAIDQIRQRRQLAAGGISSANKLVAKRLPTLATNQVHPGHHKHRGSRIQSMFGTNNNAETGVSKLVLEDIRQGEEELKEELDKFKGVTLSFLESFVKENKIGCELSCKDVCELFVKPKTAPDATLGQSTSKAYVDLLQKTQPSWVSHPTFMVSYSWSYSFIELLDTLRVFENEFPPYEGEKNFYFIDQFSLDQHDFHHDCTSISEMRYKLVKTLKNSIRAAGKVVMCATPWRDPIPLHRAWCLYEIHCALTMGADVFMAIPPLDAVDLHQTLTTRRKSEKPFDMKQILKRVDMEQSSATKQEDLEMIFEDIRSSTGFTSFNEIVQNYMEQALNAAASRQVCKGHPKSLGLHPQYPDREKVPAQQVGWETNFSTYRPIDYLHTTVKNNDCTTNPNGWADPQDVTMVDFTQRKSYLGQITLLSDGRPRNPIGRTGIRNRGLLGKWGPNHAADPIVTRWVKDTLQMVAIRRQDSGVWAIPGGMVGQDEVVSQIVRKEFLASFEANAKTEDSSPRRRERSINLRKNKTEVSSTDPAPMGQKVEQLFDSGAVVYRGYSDDPRNTDNAWMETTAMHFHCNDELGASLNLPLWNDSESEGRMRWLPLEDNTVLYASHEAFVQIVKTRLFTQRSQKLLTPLA